MVAGILWSLGCWVGITNRGDGFNPLGYFENRRLKRSLKDTYGFDLLGEFPKTKPGWRKHVEITVDFEGYRRGPWLFKTGVHYAGIWDEFDPIVVKVMRNRDRIIESYERYGGIWKRFGAEDGARIVDRGLDRLRELPGIEIDADQLVNGDREGIKAVCKQASLTYDEKTVTDFIMPGVFHAG